MSDTLVDGRRFRILCVIDDFSRECLATIFDNSISGQRVARELDGSSLAVPQNTAMWHIAMPAEEPSTASEAASLATNLAAMGKMNCRGWRVKPLHRQPPKLGYEHHAIE